MDFIFTFFRHYFRANHLKCVDSLRAWLHSKLFFVYILNEFWIIVWKKNFGIGKMATSLSSTYTTVTKPKWTSSLFATYSSTTSSCSSSSPSSVTSSPNSDPAPSDYLSSFLNYKRSHNHHSSSSMSSLTNEHFSSKANTITSTIVSNNGPGIIKSHATRSNRSDHPKITERTFFLWEKCWIFLLHEFFFISHFSFNSIWFHSLQSLKLSLFLQSIIFDLNSTITLPDR